MKTSIRFLKFLLFAFILIFSSNSSNAQLFKRLKQTVQNHIENRTEQRTGEATNKAMDKTEAAAKGDKSSSNSSSSKSSQTSSDKNEVSNNASSQPTIKSYKNYDFVPGDTVIFESNLVDEQIGEIPSQFTLSDGQVDVQQEDGKNVIHVPQGPGAVITPRMSKATYMPDQFTVEFDFKNQLFGVDHLSVEFGQGAYDSGNGILPGIAFNNESLHWTLGDVNYPESLHVDGGYPMQWHHIAIAINKTVGKVYIDQFRVANVNNLTGKPKNVTIQVDGFENSYIKNIRVASGGIDIYKKVTTDSKIIMHGILFDVDKATLQPESMGSINQIYNLLKKDPSLKFEIDGHTDNTSDAAHNLTLSQQRADAVKTQLVSMGIDASRLSTKGFGDTKPIDKNDTPEGKANNRRVEFVKI